PPDRATAARVVVLQPARTCRRTRSTGAPLPGDAAGRRARLCHRSAQLPPPSRSDRHDVPSRSGGTGPALCRGAAPARYDPRHRKILSRRGPATAVASAASRGALSGAVLVARKMAALDGQIVLARRRIPDQLRGIREDLTLTSATLYGNRAN